MPQTSFSVPVFQSTLNGVDESLVDARTLHKVLQVGKAFAAWIRNRIDEYNFIENQDFTFAIQNGKAKQRGGHNKIDYHLTLNMAKELAMIEKTDIGRMVRRYFIQCERLAFNQHSAGNGKVTEPQKQQIKEAVNKRHH
ncbi:antA/AntB antirepressor family protein [Vitreoscilla massiliensis]|uniref:AntA/AntB antirepressor family protein n=1 Tax=Vitreoscilla massiliensis TaxID=1689272 RepID=A0ABY4E0D6_9NEIS|nr:antA/AntB antirepressor family protein [Vitreoscilla massiliensis]UOO89191.1 antA/AntB antirepressor family protein [Vitreoscilla massiliensis]